MTAEILLSRLEGVRTTGPGRWIAKCPAHDDRKASLAIREVEDGRVLLHDFAGCDVYSVLSAAGVSMEELFPPRELIHGKPIRRPFNAIDVLRCVAFESLVVAVAAGRLAKGLALSASAQDRLILAASRLQRAAEVAENA